jgi:hypothetical protein
MGGETTAEQIVEQLSDIATVEGAESLRAVGCSSAVTLGGAEKAMLSGVEEALGEFLGRNRQSDFAGAQKAGREAVWGGERRSGRAGAHKELRPAMESIT